ncbi:ArnT family glycosyltransferase [Verrucomicrobiota bacterium]
MKIPIKKSLMWIAVSVISAIALTHMFAASVRGINIYDEGVSVYGAMRILSGDIPYRDFWTIYAPGQFYVLAALFRIFPASLLTGRIFTVFVLLAISFAVYAITNRIQNRKSALLAWILSLVWLSSFRFYCSSVPAALLCSLLSCLFFIRFVSDRKILNILFAGFLAGLATIFRHDLGLCFIAGQLLVAALFSMRQPDKAVIKPRKAKYLATFMLIGGFITATIPVLMFFICKVPAKIIINDLLIFPLKVFPEVRSVPYPLPGIHTMAFYFVPLTFVSALFHIVPGMKRGINDATDHKNIGLLMLVVTEMLFFTHVTVRSDISHLLPSIIPGIILFAVMSDDAYKAITRGTGAGIGRIRLTIAIIMTVTALLAFLKPFTEQIAYMTDILNSKCYVMKLKRAVGIRLRPHESVYEDIIRKVQEVVPEGGKIFVGNMRHDRIPMNDIMFYFLSERESVTKYHELHPGLATTEEIQKEIIEEIAQNGVEYVILTQFNDLEPNQTSSKGADVLDIYIRTHFKPIITLESYSIWKKLTK